MKKYRLPDNDEWEKIVDEAFSSGDDHKFSENYEIKKQSIQKGNVIMKKHNILMNLTVAAAAFAVVAFPTGIYFATRTAETTPAKELPAEEETSELASQVAEKENDTIYDFEYGWLPEGFAYNADDEQRTAYDTRHRIFMFATTFIKNVSGEETEKDSRFTLRDEYQTEDRTIEIRYNDSYVENLNDVDITNYGRMATIYFKDTPYELSLRVADDISQEDFKKIIENIKLIESDTETAYVYHDANDKIYNVEFEWVPDGFSYNSDESYMYFTNIDNKKIFMIASFIKNLSGEKTENGKALTVRDEYNIDDKTIEIRYQDNYVENSEDKDTTNYGRVATIYFKDTPYELELLVTDDVTKEDFAKIIENIRFVPSCKEIAEIYTGEQVTETEFTISDGNDDGEVNEGIHEFKEDDIDYDTIYDVAYCWLPEGLEYQYQDSPYGGKFHNWTTNDGMTPMFTKVQKGVTYYEDTGNPEIKTTRNEWLLDGKTVSMYYRDSYNPENPELNFGRIAFIYFDNTRYVLKLYVTDGISEEDFRKIIDNVKLVPSEGETASIYTGEDEKMLQEYRSGHTENTEFTVGSYERLGTPADSVPVVQVGEPVQEIYPDAWGEVSATVTGVRFDNDFNGLTTDGIGLETDYSEYLNEDGTLTENVRRWVGSETEYGTETVPVSVMTVNITYTNNGTTSIGLGGYCVCPTLQTQYDGYFFRQRIFDIIKKETEISTYNIDCIDTFRPLTADDMHFSFSCPNQSSKNNIHLEPGESTEVRLAFIVEDKHRDNLYLSMNDNGFVDLSNLE